MKGAKATLFVNKDMKIHCKDPKNKEKVLPKKLEVRASTKKPKNQQCSKMIASTVNNSFIDAPGSEHEDNSSDDDDFSLMNSAFVQSAMKVKRNSKSNTIAQAKNKHSQNTKNHLSDDIKQKPKVSTSSTIDNKDEISKNKHPENTSEAWGIKGHKLILNGNKQKAIVYLTNAIMLDNTDIRHYINRSFCYLCMGLFHETLKDVNYVMIHSKDQSIMSQMKCREGQAWWGLKKYDRAIKCFNETLAITRNSFAIRCEILRMKVETLTEMGFSEKCVLEVLYKSPTVNITDAISILQEYENTEADNNIDLDEAMNEIFESDSEESPSNTGLFMKAVRFVSENKDDTSRHLIQTEDSIHNINERKITKPDPKLVELKSRNSPAISKVSTNKLKINDKAIWVGNIYPQITENILSKKFSKFGKVVSAFIPFGEKYGFVNFVETASAEKAVKAEVLEISGINVIIKPGLIK